MLEDVLVTPECVMAMIPARLRGAEGSWKIHFEFLRHDPAAITLVVTPTDNPRQPEEIEWTFSRELMRRGINEGDSGIEGDVRFWRCDLEIEHNHEEGVMHLVLKSAEGIAILKFQELDLCTFLILADTLVPPSLEVGQYPVDQWIEWMLEESNGDS